jgi:hypothetical protein
MIDREAAISLMTSWLADHPADGGYGSPLELCILEDRTIEADFGWVFFYTSKLHRETGDWRHATSRERSSDR